MWQNGGTVWHSSTQIVNYDISRDDRGVFVFGIGQPSESNHDGLTKMNIVNDDLSQLLTTSKLENSQNMYKNVHNTQDVKKCQNFTK